MQPDGIKKGCYLCRRKTGLAEHRIFGAPNDNRSAKDGLTVFLCSECLYGQNGVVNNTSIDGQLKAVAQRKWMTHYGMTESDFRRVYGKSYI